MHSCRSTDTSPYNAPEDWRYDAADGDKKQYLNSSSAILEEASVDEASTSNSSTPQKSADKARTMRSWLERAKMAREAVMGSDGVSRAAAILHSTSESDSSDDDILFEHPSMRRESAEIPDPPPTSARSIFLQNLKKLDSEEGRNHSSSDLPNPPSSHPIYIGRVDSSSDRYSRATASLARNLSDAKDAIHSASPRGGGRLGEAHGVGLSGSMPAYDTHRSSSYNIGGATSYSEERSRRNSEHAYAYVNASTGRSSFREREGAYYGGTYSEAGISLGGASSSVRTSSRMPEHPAGSEQARIAVYEYRCKCV
jgi:hypothetical protein